MVLLLLALGGVALAAACRRSVGRHVEALHAAMELQRRWGALTCRRVMLSVADETISRAQPVAGEPRLTSVRGHFKLGSLPFDVVLADDQSKVNINALYAHGGRRTADAAIKSLLRSRKMGGAIRTALPPEPRAHLKRPNALLSASPGAVDEEDNAVAAVVGSFSQVFAAPSAAELWPGPDAASPAALLTCWGDGLLNFRTAPRSALLAVCSPVLSPAQVNRLIQVRAASPDIPLDRALALVGMNQNDRFRMGGRLTDQSWCYSLWVVAREPQRSWYALYVRDEIDEDRVAHFAFEW